MHCLISLLLGGGKQLIILATLLHQRKELPITTATAIPPKPSTSPASVPLGGVLSVLGSCRVFPGGKGKVWAARLCAIA